MVRQRCEKEKNIRCVFVESICNDKDVLEANYRMKLLSPDYMHMDPQEALEDFRERVKNYERAYVTLSEETEGALLSYIKLIDIGRKV
jgi:6-phosphofructo-2-kinase